MTSKLGLIGLGTMGSALAQNIASRGYSLSLWNRTQDKISEFVEKYGTQQYYAPESFEDFIESIEKPRRIIIMVPAGKATEAVIKQLLPVLDKDDTIMDGGNTFFKSTEETIAKLDDKGIFLLGCGISGGEEGALKGPSFMPGGPIEAWADFEDVLSSAAAEDFNGKACVSYMGRGGAGHFVKMVHNGIEYAEIQMLAEAFDLLSTLYKLKYDEIADVFSKWNEGRLSSFLTEISIDVLEKEEDGRPLLDLILDKAKQKGTGTWTSQEALGLGVPTPSITNSVYMRALSNDKDSRTKLSKEYPSESEAPNMLVSEFIEHLEKALFATRIANFEQGFALMRAAEEAYGFGLNLPEIARIWQGGCIIRCELLRDFHGALQNENQSLYFAYFAKKAIKDAYKSWQLIVSLAAEHSMPLAAISGSLMHFEAYRRERMSANFVQGLRDRFGAHTYERIDKEGPFHTQW